MKSVSFSFDVDGYFPWTFPPADGDTPDYVEELRDRIGKCIMDYCHKQFDSEYQGHMFNDSAVWIKKKESHQNYIDVVWKNPDYKEYRDDPDEIDGKFVLRF